jgi:hypothetical protein
LEPRLGRDLSPDEAKQIAANVTGFFSLLAEWSRHEGQAPLNVGTSNVEDADASRNALTKVSPVLDMTTRRRQLAR